MVISFFFLFSFFSLFFPTIKASYSAPREEHECHQSLSELPSGLPASSPAVHKSFDPCWFGKSAMCTMHKIMDQATKHVSKERTFAFNFFEKEREARLRSNHIYLMVLDTILCTEDSRKQHITHRHRDLVSFLMLPACVGFWLSEWTHSTEAYGARIEWESCESIFKRRLSRGLSQMIDDSDVP